MRVPGTDTSEPHLRPRRAGEQPVRSAEFIRTNLERSALDVDRHQFSGIPRTEPGLDFLLLDGITAPGGLDHTMLRLRHVAPLVAGYICSMSPQSCFTTRSA
jgi:hypothetical protein